MKTHKISLMKYDSKDYVAFVPLIIKIQALWRGRIMRRKYSSQLKGRKTIIPTIKSTKESQGWSNWTTLNNKGNYITIIYLVKLLEEQVKELTSIKNQHEEALSYLFEQVKILRTKVK